MRLVLAIIFAIALGWIGLGMLRSLGFRPNSTYDEVRESPKGFRTLFWCETCDTEVLLLRRGSDKAPRHCGETMAERQEVERE